jgi:hypothetical protein
MKRQILISLILLSSVLAVNAQQIGDGYAPTITNFGAILQSGVYTGGSPNGSIPEGGWQHLFVIRHGNLNNNYQLQIGSSVNENDKLYFRKIADGGLNPQNPSWIELATRGSNTFTGNQYFPGNSILTLDGKAGIGTIAPTDKLQIGNFNNTEDLKINIPGVYNFEQIKLGQYGNGAGALEFINHTNGVNSYGVRLYLNTDNGINGLQIQTANPSNSYQSMSYTTRFAITTDGNIGIGTIHPAYKLDVIGTIRAREIKVDLNGADFVFEKDYKLMSLTELEKFVKEQKHLPEIAPAKEMKENGTELGDLNSKLLQKMEEMTLYMIEQNKAIDELKQALKLQSEEIEKLKTASK